MNENLKSAMNAKNINIETIARILGVHRNTAANKVNGETEFTIQESFTLKRCVFPEYELEYLFDKNDDQRPNKAG